ncbi:hypothetical protein TSOC_004895 [Tetrabaena socialis]|uniref:Vacuolar protein sorting-associated protein 13 VPS13 adaptor binding domain-containing protein n=1 Tax=Tetrabaena socialis TaxID=47790 RepID=A0A2J8A7S9_9CHLO|nr:hypothetical protein TSOC_004895 [Tetrabaena socialis]|eukprot:PNH08540.1 hypothetical protein TSOC_004895 [Tetrabaena socialis]
MVVVLSEGQGSPQLRQQTRSQLRPRRMEHDTAMRHEYSIGDKGGPQPPNPSSRTNHNGLLHMSPASSASSSQRSDLESISSCTEAISRLEERGSLSASLMLPLPLPLMLPLMLAAAPEAARSPCTSTTPTADSSSSNNSRYCGGRASVETGWGWTGWEPSTRPLRPQIPLPPMPSVPHGSNISGASPGGVSLTYSAETAIVHAGSAAESGCRFTSGGGAPASAAVAITVAAAGGDLPPLPPGLCGAGQQHRRPLTDSDAEPEDGAPGACGAAKRWFQRGEKTVLVSRLYQFAVEVWPAPNSSVFRRTKIITVKNKYLLLNATGLPIEYKQKGTPDPDCAAYGTGPRFSSRLQHSWRAAWHWDNAHEEQEMMIRPAGGEWEWSGSFKLPDNEDYFGLRIRHRHRREYVIIPVNITVGAAGSVLVTFKSKESMPPYIVINRCRDVVIRLKQADWRGRGAWGHAWEDWDEILPNMHASRLRRCYSADTTLSL